MRTTLFAVLLSAVAGAFVLSATSAAAQPQAVTYLGRSVRLVPPDGFCTLGASAAERDMVNFQRHNTSPAGELAQFAVPCSELADLKAGKTDHFTRWVQVLVLKQKGQLKPVTASRETFVRGVAGSAALQRPDMEGVAARLREHLSKTGTSIADPVAVPIGATDEAFFMQMTMTATVGTYTSPVAAVMAVTVVNQLPLAVYSFATPKAKGADLADTAKVYLRSVIQLN